MDIQDVLKEMREMSEINSNFRIAKDWADAIDQAMREPVAEVRACEWGWCMKLLAPDAVDHGTKLYALPPNPTP